jgi:hypothetical protein
MTARSSPLLGTPGAGKGMVEEVGKRVEVEEALAAR